MEKLENLQIIYKGMCPIPGCKGNVSIHDLLEGRGCEEHKDMKILSVNAETIFEPFGIKPWGAQRIWVRRFLRRESFAMVAPTGSGKTTTAMILALYSAINEKRRSLIILPTSTLASQVEERLLQYAQKSGYTEIKVVGFHSLSPKPNFETLSSSDIIVTTSVSLVRNREMFSKIKVDIVFIDDVDGFLRRSKAIDTVLEMIEVKKEQLEIVEKLISLKRGKNQNEEEISQLRKKVRLVNKQIIVSGATQTARRTKRIRMLSELVGFEIGTKVMAARNIVDVYLYPRENLEEELVKIIRKLGKGAIVFVQGTEKVLATADFLAKKGINAAPYIKASKKTFKAFENGEIDVLVGTATLRSSLVRGIDLPEAIRYVVFLGVPKYTIKVSREDFTPAKMLVVLGAIVKHLKNDNDKIKCGEIIDKLRRIINISKMSLDNIRSGNIGEDKFLKYAKEVMEESIEFFEKVATDPEISKNVGIVKNQLVFPDSLTYIQASGRSSRLTLSGITKGLSIVIVDEERSFELLKQQLEIVDVKFSSIEEVNIEEVIKEIDETRKLKKGEEIEMESILLVVESPTKAKTISYFFGRPMKRNVGNLVTYEVVTKGKLLIVTSTRGHIFELDINEQSFGAIYENGNLTTYFKEIEGKEGTVEALRKLSQDVDKVLVATDPDAEGEKIAWDIMSMIYPFNKNIKRVRYHEVTKKVIEQAISNPEDFDANLLKAQILRVVEDAWIGLSLSRKVQDTFGKRWLSAGRVQTPVLGWIVERTKENRENKVELLRITLENGFTLPPLRLPEGSYKKLKEEGKVRIKIEKEEVEVVNPPPPFTTDTMLSEATRNLKISSEEVMRLAQDLFEAGLCTYHRTDSTTVSAVGIGIAKQYLSKMGRLEVYVGRPWTSEGAHECIRPTRPFDTEELEVAIKSRILPVQIPITRRHMELYNLIFRRFIASQMAPAKVRYVTILVEVLGNKFEFKLPFRIEEHGFDLATPIQLVPIKLEDFKKEEYEIVEINKKIVGEKSLYNESEVIRLMKEKQIGRPSTYATIIKKLEDRGYVSRLKKTSQFISLKLGEEVYRFLIQNFNSLVNEERTQKVLRAMDLIESGNANFLEVLDSFYKEVSDLLKESIKLGAA